MTPLSSRRISARDLMNSAVLAVRSELTAVELANFLIENEISGAPVENGDGELVGVVSALDLARAVADPATRDRLSEVTVADLMTPEVRSVDEDAPVEQVALAMLHAHVHRVVVTRDDEPRGLISSTDLMGLLVEGH